jgi:hypothetical protein
MLLKGLTHGLQLVEIFLATPSPLEGREMGRPPVNTGSGGEASFLRQNHFFRHPFIELGMGMSR